MGLGKTALALDDFVDYAMADEALFHLIFCPNSLKDNWETEAREFGMTMPVFVWNGEPPPKRLEPPFQFVINYEALLYSGGKYVYDLIKRYEKRFLLTADETSKIKNFKASTSRVVNDMGLYASATRALTGTPMSNNVMDLWPQLRFVRGLKGINPYQFRNRYAVMGGYLGKQVVGLRKENEAELKALMDECSFTATKDEWWDDQPQKLFPNPRQVRMSKRQQELYDDMETDFMVMLDDESVTAPMVITVLEKLQQISSGFLIKEDGAVVRLVEPKHNPKVAEVRSILEEVQGKSLVFCYHVDAVDILMEALKDWNPAVMRGGMGKERLNEQKLAFNSDDSVRVLVAQSSVGGMGHTLLGSGPGRNRCTTTIFFENDYSLINRTQAEDRNHRHGQDANHITYLDIISSRTEAKTVKALQKKLDLIRTLRDR